MSSFAFVIIESPCCRFSASLSLRGHHSKERKGHWENFVVDYKLKCEHKLLSSVIMVVKMAGLREKQKADRHRRMVSAASQLFTKHGYDATSMEAIADKAAVSVGTVYNYYESKSEILLAIVVQEGEDTYASGQILLNEAENGASSVLDDLVVLYLKSPLRFMRKPEWRQAIALSILQPETRFGRQYRQVENRLEALSSQAIENLVERGELVGVSDPTALGKVLFHTVHAAFVAFISGEDVKFDDIHAELKTRIDAMLSCYLP